MPDYKQMYFTLFHACEEAVNILIAAQQACEDIYVKAPEPELKVLTQEQREAGEE